MEAQVPHSSWGLDLLLLLSGRLFAEKKLLQKDGLKPVKKISKERKQASIKCLIRTY